jgi:hypothetical protein
VVVFVPVFIPVMVAMIVAPGPVFLLFFRAEFVEIAVVVTMSLIGPAMVVDSLVVVPDVIVSVVRVIHAVGMVLSASESRQGRGQCSCQE